jgi:hypothetical protein
VPLVSVVAVQCASRYRRSLTRAKVAMNAVILGPGPMPTTKRGADDSSGGGVPRHASMAIDARITTLRMADAVSHAPARLKRRAR